MFLKELRTPEQHAFLALAKFIARSNGWISQQEQALLDAYADEIGSDVPLAEGFDFDEALAVFESERSRRIAFLELAAVVRAEGVPYGEKDDTMARIQRALGFDDQTREQFYAWITDLTGVYARGAKLLDGVAVSVGA